MSYTGHPLLGDGIYGDKNKLGVNHQMLHAGVLGFEHPVTKEYIEFERDIPEEFQEIINKLRGK
jgi:23S rRNA pseudouridine1911/1915/1917 synthase